MLMFYETIFSNPSIFYVSAILILTPLNGDGHFWKSRKYFYIFATYPYLKALYIPLSACRKEVIGYWL